MMITVTKNAAATVADGDDNDKQDNENADEALEGAGGKT